MERFGQLNSVVANAGIHRCNTLLDIADEELDLMIQTNIYGTVNTLREAVPHIIEAGGGTVVINASDQWFVGKPNSFAYGLTKGALGQITRSLSIDLGSKGIRVNAVCAGTIHAPLVDNLFKNFAQVNNCSIDDYWKAENELYARGSFATDKETKMEKGLFAEAGLRLSIRLCSLGARHAEIHLRSRWKLAATEIG